MKIDYSILEPFMDGLFTNLLLLMVVPFIAVLPIKTFLLNIKIPNLIALTISSIVYLAGVYVMFGLIV